MLYFDSCLGFQVYRCNHGLNPNLLAMGRRHVDLHLLAIDGFCSYLNHMSIRVAYKHYLLAVPTRLSECLFFFNAFLCHACPA